MNDSVPSAAGGLRALTRESVRARIAEHALVIFDEFGFDATTVDDIVAVVGISPRSFFRYFPSKEDVVIGDLLPAGARLRDEVATRIGQESAWSALHGAMRVGADEMDADSVRWLRTMRVINGAASLRARNLEKHLTWSTLLVPIVAEHVAPDEQLGDLPARTLVSMAFACLDAALASWTEADGAVSFGEALDAAFGAR